MMYCIIIFGNFYLILYIVVWARTDQTIPHYPQRFAAFSRCVFMFILPIPSETCSRNGFRNKRWSHPRTKNMQLVSVSSIFSQASDPMLELQSLGFGGGSNGGKFLTQRCGCWIMSFVNGNIGEFRMIWWMISGQMTCHVTLVHPYNRQHFM